MAVEDKDWQDFLNSTEKNDPDVETELDEEPEDEKDDLDEEEEAPTKNDPKKGKENTPDDQEEGDDPEEDDEEEDPEKDKPEEYKPRLKQFIDKDGKYNLEKAEKSYIESGKQAVKLEKDLKESNDTLEEVRNGYSQLLGAIKAKPEVAKQLFGEDGAKRLLADQNIPNGGTPQVGSESNADISGHPLLRHLEAQFQNRNKKEYDDFIETHPEAISDPERKRKIGEFLEIRGPLYTKQNNGEIMSLAQGLKEAYEHYGWDKEDAEAEKVATAAKKAAATRSNGGAKTTKKKSEVSKGEDFFAKKLGVKL